MSTRCRVGMIALVVAVLAGFSSGPGAARDRGDVPAPKVSGSQEVEVLAAYLDPATQAPVIMLRGKRDKRSFPMVIGPAELNAIALPLNGVTPPRPLTHDLFLTLFSRLKVSLRDVVITDFRDDIYYAVLHLQSAAGDLTLDSRPSDAIALALRAGVPVLVEDQVFDKAAAAGREPTPRRPSI
jgi:uncharacterized protein